ncbi:MAG: hemolysin III family protein [Puniceicoccales bacterium]|nr:hemolysin III family protein [Puniceicoccales bacterium]
MEKVHTQYTIGEEIANSTTHGIGILLSIAGLAVLVTMAALYSDAWAVVGASIFGSTLILLYSSSTLYHSFRNEKIKRFLRKCDHAAIFLLIAGSYTPFLLVNLRGPWGWSLFGVIWGMAVVGIVLKFWFTGRFRLLSTLIYIGMGWLVLIALKPMLESVSPAGMWLLFAGGLCYTGGAGFYMMKKVKYHHAIWHGFVMAGSICHYFAVLCAIIP